MSVHGIMACYEPCGQNDNMLQVALAVALQSVGNQGFDKLTKTNVVAMLLKVGHDIAFHSHCTTIRVKYTSMQVRPA